jgi:hypothetical protein
VLITKRCSLDRHILLLSLSPSKWRFLPFKFVWDIRSYKLSVNWISAFTNNVQVDVKALRKTCLAAYQHPLFIWVFFDYGPRENCFNHMFAFKTFFQGVLHSVALDEVSPGSYSFADNLDIHAALPSIKRFRFSIVSLAQYI